MSYRGARYDIDRDEEGMFMIVAHVERDKTVPVGMMSQHFPLRIVQEMVNVLNKLDPTCAIVRERERA